MVDLEHVFSAFEGQPVAAVVAPSMMFGGEWWKGDRIRLVFVREGDGVQPCADADGWQLNKSVYHQGRACEIEYWYSGEIEGAIARAEESSSSAAGGDDMPASRTLAMFDILMRGACLAGNEQVEAWRARLARSHIADAVCRTEFRQAGRLVETAICLLADELPEHAVMPAATAFGHAIDGHLARNGYLIPCASERRQRYQLLSSQMSGRDQTLSFGDYWKLQTMSGLAEGSYERWTVRAVNASLAIIAAADLGRDFEGLLALWSTAHAESEMCG
ncbi:hypothetical protein GXW82_43140 [Streptacidiphilus sp. 4-A2]|nr:hypothetical protein [Streptacidiphilus sp. 4-A2]